MPSGFIFQLEPHAGLNIMIKHGKIVDVDFTMCEICVRELPFCPQLTKANLKCYSNTIVDVFLHDFFLFPSEIPVSKTNGLISPLF
jgi:hypothetical protein